jgi:plasmid stabilization system protein ParE
VPRRSRITLATSAVADLEAVRCWYSVEGAPEVGERLLGELLEQIDRLADYPRSGRQVPEIGAGKVREVLHPPFRIVYRLDEGHVRVVRVWRCERLLRMPPG